MLKRYHHIVGGLFRTVDALVIGAAWLCAYWLRFTLPLIEVTKGFPAFETYASLTPLVMALWMVVFSGMKVYQSQRMLRRTHEVHLLIRSHGVAILFFIALTYMFSDYKYSRAVMLYFGVLGGILLVGFRLTLRNLLRTLRKRGYNLRYVLLVGEGKPIEVLTQRLDKFPELGLRVVGIIQSKDGYLTEIARAIQEKSVDRVVIALPRNQYAELDPILESLKNETIDVQLIPDIHEYVTLGCEIEDFDGLPIVNLNDSPLQGWGAILKRMTDLFLSFITLLILTPLFSLIAIGIKLTSRGPIFYSQERMGLDGRTFKMYKFRSMRADAEAQSGAVWAKQGDDRRTRFGTFLRSTSLDELPQFWNVLVGHMSLVGPRPERPIFVNEFRKNISHYMLRHKVKAGITGWAQVNGWRGNTSLERRIECDLYYIRNWSYLFDWKILLLTLWKGFINRNAY